MYKIGVTQGMRGWFAVLYSTDGAGGYEPIQSGFDSYETTEEAREDAKAWSRAENIPTDF